MSQADDETTGPPAADILARFLGSHPGGSEEQFKAWAASQPELKSDPGLRSGASKLLQDWLRAHAPVEWGQMRFPIIIALSVAVVAAASAVLVTMAPQEKSFEWVLTIDSDPSVTTTVSGPGGPIDHGQQDVDVFLNDQLLGTNEVSITDEIAAERGQQVPWMEALANDPAALIAAVEEQFELAPGRAAGLPSDEMEGDIATRWIFELNLLGVRFDPGSSAVARALGFNWLTNANELDPFIVLVTREAGSNSAHLNLIRYRAHGNGLALSGIGGNHEYPKVGGGQHYRVRSQIEGQTYPLPLPEGFNEYPVMSGDDWSSDSRMVPAATSWWISQFGPDADMLRN